MIDDWWGMCFCHFLKEKYTTNVEFLLKNCFSSLVFSNLVLMNGCGKLMLMEPGVNGLMFTLDKERWAETKVVVAAGSFHSVFFFTLQTHLNLRYTGQRLNEQVHCLNE